MIAIKWRNPLMTMMILLKSLKKEIIQEEAPKGRVTCFECGKRGHVKSECPTLEKKKKEKTRITKRKRKHM